jgi:hypothetical protein
MAGTPDGGSEHPGHPPPILSLGIHPTPLRAAHWYARQTEREVEASVLAVLDVDF